MKICYNTQSCLAFIGEFFIKLQSTHQGTHMRKILIALLPLLLISTLHAKKFSISDGDISFDAPDGFKPMSAELIKIKYPKGNPPSNALMNDSTETSIVFDLRGGALPQSDIERTRMAYASTYKRVVGGFELKVNKTAKIAGQKWAQLEFVSNTIDSKVYNIMLVTGYKKQMLIFNFNSTLKEFKKYEKAIRKSIKSITLK